MWPPTLRMPAAISAACIGAFRSCVLMVLQLDDLQPITGGWSPCLRELHLPDIMHITENVVWDICQAGLRLLKMFPHLRSPQLPPTCHQYYSPL